MPSNVYIRAMAAAASCAFCAQAALGQSSNFFTVVSPLQGQVFAPGASIPISVRATPGTSLAMVIVSSRIGTANVLPSTPISLTAPQDPLGPTLISVIGQTTAGDSAEVDVAVDVESPQMLQSITVIPTPLTLAAAATSKYLPGLSTVTLDVLGTLADGTQHNIATSTKTSYASNNSLVATMDSAGNITAVGPGIAQVTVTNAGDGTQMPVTAQVLVTVNIFELRGDLDGDSDVDTDDITVITAALNTSATGPGDPRDLDGDGRITVNDISILRTLCSRRNCATE